MLYIIAFLLLVIVLANETSRNILLGLIGISLTLVVAAVVLIVIVIMGYLLVTGKFSNASGSISLWFNNFSRDYPYVPIFIVLALLLIVIVDIIRNKRDLKNMQRRIMQDNIQDWIFDLRVHYVILMHIKNLMNHPNHY